MNKQGVVVAKDGSLATVEIFNNPNCLACKKRTNQLACRSCADYDEKLSYRIVASNEVDAEIGNRVCVKESKKQKLILALVSFVIPVACAVIAYLFMSFISDDEQLISRVAVISAIIAVIIAGLYSYKVSKSACDYKIISIEDED
jgi:positive regulator of sigma E activity